ncbi:MAG: trypsin-like serine protease [Bdellovibrio sp.]|nr:trypsin-like serine protease [Bdellovibrio sp.]
MTAKLTLFLGCVLLLFGCADRNASDNSRLAGGIVLGEPVENDAFIAQHTVMLAFNYEYNDNQVNFFGVCTGTVVDERTILTAAHCLEDGIKNIKVLYSADPRKNLDIETDVYTIIDKKIHTNYIAKDALKKSLEGLSSDNDRARALTRSSDIALAYLDRPLKMNIPFSAVAYKKPLDINRENSTTQITIVGYGRTSSLKNDNEKSFDQLNGVLQKAELSVDTSQFSHTGFFLRQWSTPGICKGDSGGPVFTKDSNGDLRVVALAVTVYSFNNKAERALDPDKEYTTCASHGLYLNIEQYKPWIAKNIYR